MIRTQVSLPADLMARAKRAADDRRLSAESACDEWTYLADALVVPVDMQDPEVVVERGLCDQ